MAIEAFNFSKVVLGLMFHDKHDMIRELEDKKYIGQYPSVDDQR